MVATHFTDIYRSLGPNELIKKEMLDNHKEEFTGYQRLVNMVVADALVPTRHQGICNHHVDLYRNVNPQVFSHLMEKAVDFAEQYKQQSKHLKTPGW